MKRPRGSGCGSVGDWLVGLASLFLLVTSPGCGRSEADPLEVGVVIWPPYELIYLAQETGVLNDRRIHLVAYESPAEVQADYLNGRLDVLFMTAGYSVQCERVQPGQRVVYVLDVSSGGDALVARSGFASVAELRGARIGYEPGPLGVYMLQSALKSGGLTVDDVQAVPLDVGSHRGSYDAGRVDAVVTYEPVVTELVERGAKVLFDSSEIPGEIIDVIQTRAVVVEHRRDDLAHLIAAFEEARQRFERDPEELASIAARRTGLDDRQFLEGIAKAELMDRDANRALLTGDDPRLKRRLEWMVAFLEREAGPAEHPVRVDKIITASCLAPAGSNRP